VVVGLKRRLGRQIGKRINSLFFQKTRKGLRKGGKEGIEGYLENGLDFFKVLS